MVPLIETPRLLLKPIELADAPQIQAIFPRWEIVKFLNSKVPWPYPPDGASQFLTNIALPAVERGEEWLWSIRRRAQPGALIGLIMLSKAENKNRGFWLDPQFQGQGYMTEACDAVTNFWFETVLRSHKAIANESSRRISIAQGMRLVWSGDHNYVGGTFPSENVGNHCGRMARPETQQIKN